MMELQNHEYGNPAALTKLRNDRFRKLVSHCYFNVPYYRKIMDRHRLSPKDFNNTDDIVKLPILDRKTLNANTKSLRSQNIHSNDIRIEYTSGSTGSPAHFGVDRRNYYQVFANAWRFWAYAGYKPGMKMVMFWGSGPTDNMKNKIRKRLKEFAENTYTLNTHIFSRDKVFEYAEQLKKQHPAFIRGYAGALHMFVENCNKYKLPPPRQPVAIIITSEKILASQKNKIQKYFQAEVFEEYGSREFGILAHECSAHSGLHLAEEHFIFEVYNPLSNLSSFVGTGELLITSLVNYSMPILRYRIEDEGTIVTDYCTCGRCLHLLKQLTGRVNDYVVTNSEKLVSQILIGEFFEMVPEVICYQIKQNKKGEIDIHLILEDNYNIEKLNPMRSAMQMFFKNELKINLHRVNSIEPLPSGKRQIIKSQILQHYLPTSMKPGYIHTL